MKTWHRLSAVGVALLATLGGAASIDCSNASSSSAAVPCKDPAATGDFSQPCVDCESTLCIQEWTTVQSACADLLACEASCECANATCLSDCATAHAGASCIAAGDQLVACGQSACTTACTSGQPTDGATFDFGAAEGG